MGLVLESLGQFGQLRRSPGHTTSAQCSPLQHSHTQYGCSGQASCPAVPQASRCQPGSLLPATVPLSKRQARHILRASPVRPFSQLAVFVPDICNHYYRAASASMPQKTGCSSGLQNNWTASKQYMPCMCHLCTMRC